MSYIVTEIEEYEVEYCEVCNHPIWMHYDEPQDAYNLDGAYVYTAVGCMALTGERVLPGNNRYLRCRCMKFV